MPKYKVLVGLEWAGQNREEGSELEMAESEASEMVANGQIEEIKEETASEAGDAGETTGETGETTQGETDSAQGEQQTV